MTDVEPALFSLQNPEFWFAMASVIVIAFAWNPVGKILAKAFDARTQKIKDSIEEAEELLAEAKTALARYTGALASAEEEAQQIIERAKREAEQIRIRAAEDLDHALVARQEHALDRISQAEAAAVTEIRNATASVAIAASRTILREHLNDNQHSALIQKAVGAVQDHLR